MSYIAARKVNNTLS